ncbi:MAG TPA: ABC transporter permease subunit [bacterium]|jgi:ABC-type transport system involved in multi-copper enzyme maturation permease subunit|nr:ABC transporter permease subunit [bacterium]
MRLNRPVYLNTLRWFLDSPPRLLCAGLMALLTYLVVGGMAHMEINGVSSEGMFDTPQALASAGDKILVLLAWILGVGLIRREISSGAIQLVLLRPLSRPSYVLSKWAALATLNALFLVFCWAVLILRGGILQADKAGDLGLLFGAQVLQIFALAAVLCCLSCVPSKLGEMGTLVLAGIGILILSHYAESLDQAALRAAVDFLWKVLFPRVGAFMDTDGSGAAMSLAFNAGVTVAALGGAMALLQAREFSYAETGA